jgi:hypothetical protein
LRWSIFDILRCAIAFPAEIHCFPAGLKFAPGNTRQPWVDAALSEDKD